MKWREGWIEIVSGNVLASWLEELEEHCLEMRIISNMNCWAIINFLDLQFSVIASVSAPQYVHQSLKIFLHHFFSKPKTNKSQKIKRLKPEPYHPCYQHLSRHFRGRVVSHLEVHVQTNIHLSNWGAIWCRQSLFATPLHTHTLFMCATWRFIAFTDIKCAWVRLSSWLKK